MKSTSPRYSYAFLNNLLWFFSIFVFINAFNFQHNPPSGWQKQHMPFLNNRPISDITFIDSLTGYAVTGDNSPADTNFIVKTTDGGEVWSIVSSIYRDLSRVVFLNGETGYISGGYNVSGGFLARTSNGGTNWNTIETPSTLRIDDISVLSEDTIWIADDNGFNGGLFRTTNGGFDWELQYGGGLGGTKPNKIYFYDGLFGWAARNDMEFLFKTIDGGMNWTRISGEEGFQDIHFVDSEEGWKSYTYMGSSMKHTTNGGNTWMEQSIPSGGYILLNYVVSFSNINNDTIWGGGGALLFPNNSVRYFLNFTSNGGMNWYYQVPDTSISIVYRYLDFLNKTNGWVYATEGKGIHTTTGGDPGFLNVRQISSEVPEGFVLLQNYPNPFNATTAIRFDILRYGRVRLSVHDLTGKTMRELIDGELQAGTYEYNFNGEGLSSGVYFCSLVTRDERFTVKMVLAK